MLCWLFSGVEAPVKNNKIMKALIKSILFVTILFVTIAVIAQGDKSQGLTSRQQAIVNIASLTAVGNLERLKPALTAALEAGLTVNEIKEVLIHLYAYAGFPRSLQGIQAFMTVLDERKSKGINDKIGRIASPIKDKRSKFERGKENLAKLTGIKQDGSPIGYAAFAPEIEVFLKEHLFADLFERDVLTYAERELVTVSVNASIGGVEPMLRSHMTHSLTQGITPNQLKDLVNLVEVNVGIKEATAARNILNEVFKSKGLASEINSQTGTENGQASETIFPKGTRITNNNFTGTAWLQMLVTNDTTFNTSVGHVTFERGTRTNWHYHPGGQILLVTNGVGRYKEKGKPVRELRKGDVIKCEPNIVHWHGASPGSELSHVTIGANPSRVPVVWLQPVTDAEYNNIQ
jgi:4-carboxymuconolactone decarboxylase